MTRILNPLELEQLEAVCLLFIQEHSIRCPEDVYQADRVIENAYGLIEDICNVVGYVQDDGSVVRR